MKLRGGTRRDTDSLLHNRDFQLLGASQGLSLLGSGASALALPLLVLETTGSPVAVGLVEAAWTASLAAACLPAGSVVDRFDRRAVLLFCETGRAVVGALLAALVHFGAASLPALLVMGAVLGLLTAPFNAAGLASTQQIVPEAKLATAMAVNRVRGQAALLLGPVIGGALYTVSPGLPFWFDATTFAVSAVSLLFLRTKMAVPRPEETDEGLLRSLTAGLRFLWQDVPLRRMTLVASGQNFVLDGVYLAVIVLLAGAGGSGTSVGLITGVSAAGGIVGALIAPWLERNIAYGRALLGTGVVCAVLVAAMATTRSGPVIGALLAGCACATAASSTVMTVARTVRTPPHLQGRMHSAIGLLLMATPPLGSALTGFLLAVLPGPAVLLLLAAAMALLLPATRIPETPW
ncbi:MFS transporter [Streptomyces sp. NPDC005963]|uniref:MFS transporter n=1 Tax=Streptomyces sp. NPDC005963 TaxID=3156721 RepID=UPI0033F5DEC6